MFLLTFTWTHHSNIQASHFINSMQHVRCFYFASISFRFQFKGSYAIDRALKNLTQIYQVYQICYSTAVTTKLPRYDCTTIQNHMIA